MTENQNVMRIVLPLCRFEDPLFMREARALYPSVEFIPNEPLPDGEGDRWVDISQSQSRAIRNDNIEECAAALEQEATYNDAVARDEKDFLKTRASAEEHARVKRQCAAILRGMKR